MQVKEGILCASSTEPALLEFRLGTADIGCQSAEAVTSPKQQPERKPSRSAPRPNAPFTCDPEIRRRTIWRSHRMSAPGIHDARSLSAMSQPEGSETKDFRSSQREHARGLLNPQHLEPLSDRSELYRHLITFALTQHSPAQGGFAADDLDEFSAVEQLHVPPIRAEKDLLLLAV